MVLSAGDVCEAIENSSLCRSPGIKDYSGYVAASNRNDFLSSLGVTRLWRAEIAAAIAKAPVVFRLAPKGADIVFEVWLESLDNSLIYQVRERMQRQRRLPLSTMSLAIRPHTAG